MDRRNVDAYALAALHLADYLTADRGTRWWLWDDGTLMATDPSTRHEADRDPDGPQAIEVARSPGLGDLDSHWWTEGLYQNDDGDYECAGDVIGDFRAVVHWQCEHGDVTGQLDDFARKIRGD
jgi:hypothetical protein